MRYVFLHPRKEMSRKLCDLTTMVQGNLGLHLSRPKLHYAAYNDKVNVLLCGQQMRLPSSPVTVWNDSISDSTHREGLLCVAFLYTGLGYNLIFFFKSHGYEIEMCTVSLSKLKGPNFWLIISSNTHMLLTMLFHIRPPARVVIIFPSVSFWKHTDTLKILKYGITSKYIITIYHKKHRHSDAWTH